MMTVSLIFENFPSVTPGAGAAERIGHLRNAGDENVDKLKIKVLDVEDIFSTLQMYVYGAWNNCDNVYTTGYVYNFSDSNDRFPQGTSKQVRMKIAVRSGVSPGVKINNVECIYITY